MNWESQNFQLNKGLIAIDDFNGDTGGNIKTVIHVAQAENTAWWLLAISV
jgi:hypothetical protein